MPEPRAETFRCAAASLAGDEPLEATAPTDTRWLLVEQPTGWEPEVSLSHVERGVRVQLVRRPGGGAVDGPLRVFWAERDGSGFAVRAGHVATPDDAARLDPADLAPHRDPLLLVCTHGRRDVCCAERGRPVAAALAGHHRDATWETTHLGGHRFAATLLALPSGLALGRVDAGSAVAAVADLLAGRWPADVVRGRAGVAPREQAAEAFVRRTTGAAGLDDVVAEHDDGDRVAVRTRVGSVGVRVEPGPAVPRRQSCGDDKVKAAPTWVCSLLS